MNVLISGYGKLPAHITSEEVFKILVVAVQVDMDDATIIKAEASMVTELARSFIGDLMIGYDMSQGPEKLLDRFEKFYYGHAKKALATCIRMIFAKYDELIDPQISAE